jgi:tetratricopeptide (TPR) repeat protein
MDRKSRAEVSAMESKPPSPDADDLIARAKALYNHERAATPENTLLTSRALQQALDNVVGVEHRRVAEAWSLYAEILMCDYLNRWNDAGAANLAKAATAVERALEIAPDLAQAHYSKGLVCRARGEHQQSLAAFTQTIALNPHIPLAHAQQGAELMYTGSPAAALGPIETALKISRPDSPSRGMFYWYMGRAHFFSGNYRDAIPCLWKSVELRPNLWYNRLYLVSACALAGDTTEAKTALSEFDERFPGYTLARVAADEQTNPNNNNVVIEGRRKFHEGLVKAGIRQR